MNKFRGIAISVVLAALSLVALFQIIHVPAFWRLASIGLVSLATGAAFIFFAAALNPCHRPR
jgi:hypothetical protein